MKAIQDKCHLLVSGNNNMGMNASWVKIKNDECEKLLGIKFQCGLKFENYLNGLIKKASKKGKCFVKSYTIYEFFKKRI